MKAVLRRIIAFNKDERMNGYENELESLAGGWYGCDTDDW